MWFLSGAYVVPKGTLCDSHAHPCTLEHPLHPTWVCLGDSLVLPMDALVLPMGAYGCLGAAYGCLWVPWCAYGFLGGVGLPRGREGLLGP